MSKQLSVVSGFAAVASWLALAYMVLTQRPSLLMQVLFFPLLFVAVTSVAVPTIGWLRTRTRYGGEPGVTLREATWLGFYVSFCALLQAVRMLDLVVALVLAAILVLLELFLLQRPERIRKQWYDTTTRNREDRVRRGRR